MANLLTACAAQLGPPISQGNVLTNDTAFASTQGGSSRLIIGPPTGVMEGRVLRLRVVVKVTGGTTTNYTLKVYWSNSVNTDLTTVTGDIAIMSSGAVAFNSTTRNLMMTSEMVWDATSQRLNGAFCIMYDGGTPAFTNWALNTAAATGVAATSNLKFFATGIFSATNANNAAVLNDFSVDLL